MCPCRCVYAFGTLFPPSYTKLTYKCTHAPVLSWVREHLEWFFFLFQLSQRFLHRLIVYFYLFISVFFFFYCMMQLWWYLIFCNTQQVFPEFDFLGYAHSSIYDFTSAVPPLISKACTSQPMACDVSRNALGRLQSKDSFCHTGLKDTTGRHWSWSGLQMHSSGWKVCVGGQPCGSSHCVSHVYEFRGFKAISCVVNNTLSLSTSVQSVNK